MATLIMLRGLPGSGKSTVAADCAKSTGALVVNKDTIRRALELGGWQWSRENEKDVIRIQEDQICGLLLNGINVISDDTNFGKHEARLRQLAERCDANFTVDDFCLKVPIEECIRRDALREGKAYVGEMVIRKMAKDNGIAQVNPRKYLRPADNAPWAIICDLDGTLCLHNGRSPYDTAKCFDDLLNLPVYEVIRTLYDSRLYKIIYLSGRDEEFRGVSNGWLISKGLSARSAVHAAEGGQARRQRSQV